MAADDLPIIPVGVRNAPFALDLWAQGCPPNQFVREFTVNGIEAIAAYRQAIDPSFRGELLWTIDPTYEQVGLTKLACIDTGIGMSAPEMPDYLNDLASSGKHQSLDANYGIGAKVSAAVSNPLGVVYASWQDGVGHTVELGRDEAGTWGMRQHRRPDGDVTAVVPVPPDLKPPELGEADHGTVVTFLGETEEQDTTLAPRGERGERWIAKTLNQRFYELPEWVTVRVREIKVAGQARSVRFRVVRGQRHHLDQHTIAAGSREFEGATVHWRILDDNHEERTKQANIWASTGHRACLFQGELFEMATAARGGYEKLKEFGIRFGMERVVLYVEPHVDGSRVSQDNVRTQVKLDGEPLPWERYAQQFEEQMPDELRVFQEEIAAGSTHRDHSATVRERLADVAELFQIPRYKPADQGDRRVEEANLGGQAGMTERPKRTRKPGGPTSGGTAGNVYALFDTEDGRNARRVEAQALPEIKVDWVSVADKTREPGDLEDRAAQFDRRHSYLQINADFRGYRDILARWEKRYAGMAGARSAIEETAAGWWQQALEETILGVLALRGSQWWDERSTAEALSEISLTAAAMQRYHLDAVLKRELANRLGSVRPAA